MISRNTYTCSLTTTSTTQHTGSNNDSGGSRPKHIARSKNDFKNDEEISGLTLGEGSPEFHITLSDQ
ncbi:hypothetical protein EUTSA_v10002838mg [Eutrema salsugineum]|uniref:Uncharacterized protein n=1 Tax=Eutrema salsugineum TaxID=72664 RepID=V4MXL0_EUTSA|nr:hypothetical protein EUTSA_v10002838mg [Eutrema salsugineum]